MITTPSLAILDISLYKGCSTKLSAPNDKSIIKEASHLEVTYKGGAWLICITALSIKLCSDAVMLIPTGVHALNESNAALSKPSGH